jgi:uncharacterized protein YceH (UPF0502 family)
MAKSWEEMTVEEKLDFLRGRIQGTVTHHSASVFGAEVQTAIENLEKTVADIRARLDAIFRDSDG